MKPRGKEIGKDMRYHRDRSENPCAEYDMTM